MIYAVDLNADNSPHLLTFASTISKYKKVVYTKDYSPDYIYLCTDPGFNAVTYKNCKEKNCNFLSLGKGYTRGYGRITYNNLQQTNIFKPKYDRLYQWKYTNDWKNESNGYILILAPQENTLNFYTGFTDVIKWCNQTKNLLRNYTDKKIFIRVKDTRRNFLKDPITKYFDGCYAIVSLQSVGSIESIVNGIPAFTLSPSALDSFKGWENDISKIEKIKYVDDKSSWLNILSNSQFTPEEVENGFMFSLLEHNYGIEF